MRWSAVVTDITKIYLQQLASGHKTTCPWSDNPCSVEMIGLPQNRHQLLSEARKAVADLHRVVPADCRCLSTAVMTKLVRI